MSYVGNSPAEIYSSVQKQDLTGGSGTGFTLSYPVTNANEISVFVNNVRQEPTEAYTVSGTSLTMTGSIAASDDFYIIFSGLTQGTIAPPDDSVSTAKIQNGAVTAAKISSLPTGSVLQVVQAVKTDTQTFNANTYSAISGLSAVITPTSTSSKILVQAVIHVGASGQNEGVGGKLYRNGSEVSGARGDAAGSRDRNWFHAGEYAQTTSQSPSTPMYLDSPSSTAQLTYEVYCRAHSSGYPAYINRSEDDSDDNRRSRTISTITLMEIAG